MYKWISIVAIGSTVLTNKQFTDINFRLLLGNSILEYRPLFDMTSISSVMNVISYDYDWMPNILIDDNFDKMHTCDSINQLDTHNDTEKLLANKKLEISQINNELNQYYSLANEMPIIETMHEVDFENFENEDERKLKDKLQKHRKSSNFGFTSLQKRIERVKNDIINLTNKLNSGYVQDGNEAANSDVSSYYNLGFGNLLDSELTFSNEDTTVSSMEVINDVKTWKCPSQFIANNPYSELSENTQKILSRFHVADEVVPVNDYDQLEMQPELEDDLEMEEDEIEFTFCTSQNGLLQSYLNKGTMPIIEEEEEIDSSSDDTESIRSTILERFTLDTETIDTPKSRSLQSMDFTESESYITALTNPAVGNQALTDKTSSSFDDAEENLSDYARCSVSSDSSKESLDSDKIDKLDNETATDRTIINPDSNFDCSCTVKSIKDYSSSSMKVDEDSDSDAEYDHSSWSNEDILQSIEQSDSLYEKPYKSHIKSSLPDLLESADSHEFNNSNSFLGNRNLNKSTDLDEIMMQYQSPCHQPPKNRLSLSLCNLNTAKSENKICPSRFFQDNISNGNLMETDLDSGFVSIYQPIRETEILPAIDFSVSMMNINQDKSPSAFNSLVEKLRSKAGSIPELRIANSLNKLNVPDWLNFRHDDQPEKSPSVDETYKSFPIHSLTLPPNGVSKSPVRQLSSLPKQYKTMSFEPTIKAPLMVPMVLPSQKLRQLSLRKLTPIKSCSAREYMQPNNISTVVL